MYQLPQLRDIAAGAATAFSSLDSCGIYLLSLLLIVRPVMLFMLQEEDSSRDSPVAFTIDFGGSDNSEEKAKKLERFALRYAPHSCRLAR